MERLVCSFGLIVKGPPNGRESAPVRNFNASRVSLSADWVARRFTSDAPEYVWHAEWRVRLTIGSAAELRVIVLTRAGDSIRWRKRDRDAPTSFNVTVPFELPLDEEPASDAWTALGGKPESPRLGSLVPILRGRGHEWHQAFLALDRHDTEGLRNHRWRPRLDLNSDSVDFLLFWHGMRGHLTAAQLDS